MNRRNFFNKLVGTSLLGTGVLIAGGCNQGENKNGKDTTEKNNKFVPKDCDDYSGVEETELKRREALSYVTVSAVPGNHCSNCKLYTPKKYGNKCGGCMLFDGPVRDEGWCVQYEAATT